MRMIERAHIIGLLLLSALPLWKMSAAVPADSLTEAVRTDSLATDTLRIDSIMTDTLPKKDKLEHPIHYNAKDSIVLLGNGMAIMYGQGVVTYEDMELNAENIRMVLDSSLIYAKGRLDTIENEIIGKPVFKDGNDSYESLEMAYNMKTQKGFIREVTTEQGEGYVVADKTKKTQSDVMMMAGGRYTTCDDHDHPHFYLKMTKAKVKPGDYIATGPAYLVVGDVPVPIAIPFGFFPFTKTYTSGLIMPSIGDDYTRGLYLRNIGYYFAINDYIDLELTGDIYTKGTWAVYATSNYAKRYKFRGKVDVNYRVDKTSERGMPDYSEAKNLKIQWTHQQDSKANPYSTFSASVNFSTSGYNRSNINSYYNGELNSENTKSSSISYTQRFPNSPWNISLSASLTQRTKDSTISLTAPDLSVNMSSIYPFKRKHRVGKEKWYEKIKMSYSGNARISCNAIKEKDFLHSDFARDWQTGIKHSIPISANWMLFKYLSLTPSINLTDRMYFQKVHQEWDDAAGMVRKDTTTGFYNVFDFSLSVALSTKLYGYYIPSRKLFPHSKVDRFRHVLTPNISFSYHPDFGKSFWGYYDTYNEQIYEKNSLGEDSIDAITGQKVLKTEVMREYSCYEGAMYGNATRGLSATLNFGVQNNLEVKVRNDKDTTGKEPYKIYSIIDNFGITGAYNFAADSMNFSNFNINLRLKIPFVKYTLNLSTTLDPYMYEYDIKGNPVRTNKQYWHNKRFPHWSGTNLSLSYTFNNQTFKNWFGKDKNKNQNSTQDDGNMDEMKVQNNGSMTNAKRGGQQDTQLDEGYVKTEIPWSLTLSYSVRYADLAHTKDNFIDSKMQYKMGLTQNLSISASLGLGKGWKASMTTSYDITNKKWSYTNFNVSRDLHCWNMTASFVPFGPYKSYNFHIGVNASMLADLKYDKSDTSSTNKKVSWW
ncbi:MAG: LPS-assembly protein LptD [Paludibacteraceae bacterium]|nr:LPS-assembly protein LptD [Paludibacteraceae bacterium]